MPYTVYPVADHIADKVCALLERHRRADGQIEQSTRYRDLASRRRLALPDHLEIPSASGWAAGYARVAREAMWLEERNLDAAMSSVGRFIDPVLAGTAVGRWDPATMAWMPQR